MKTLNNTIASKGMTLKTIKTTPKKNRLSFLLLALLFGMITSQSFAQSSAIQMNHISFSNLATLGTGVSGYLANTIGAENQLVFKQKTASYNFDAIDKNLEKNLFTVFRTGLPKDDSLIVAKSRCWLECPSIASKMVKKVYVFGYTLEGSSSELSFKAANITNNSLLVFKF